GHLLRRDRDRDGLRRRTRRPPRRGPGPSGRGVRAVRGQPAGAPPGARRRDRRDTHRPVLRVRVGRQRARAMSATTVDVVLPVLDEAAAIPWVLGRMPPGYRAIVVDNGSEDGSGAIA